jgi:ABC-type phosphate/phosphonate transport system substrate-binding protein
VIPTGYALGQLFLDVSLAKAGFPSSQQFFSTVLDSNDNNSAVLDIFFDKADIAVVSNLAYEIAIELNPQIATKLNILMASEPMVPFIIGVNKRVPDSFLLPIDNILENLLENPRTRHILSLFKADDVVKIDSAQLESVKVLKQEYDRLLAAGLIQVQ